MANYKLTYGPLGSLRQYDGSLNREDRRSQIQRVSKMEEPL
jgi:hypothetical protein